MKEGERESSQPGRRERYRELPLFFFSKLLTALEWMSFGYSTLSQQLCSGLAFLFTFPCPAVAPDAPVDRSTSGGSDGLHATQDGLRGEVLSKAHLCTARFLAQLVEVLGVRVTW